ncbi:disease resistance protein Roq1-like [Carya illinoinensis]|uniref:disease resistance protein Roq1-like n=1 Tax=Carya illinoinensis TaxID=32201 RepID=UPI001C721886|nr:disease resistance protein Roq1-like [Carya illinoinensis]XP_042960787.1 disease resistance protein Roq1-like [Carya illinoinensis]XP_042960788.1 disease resistance protein Roq1-like [Carya illinoinensis]XP_042960789.1 disease resistance protein Roq1-like [Carya illinoinensis]XP_042960790.1 disease resistance protein Roq1-like [Carya illinoinensis]XP_042960791.1 disease resistance protein Roq1-like [Carya illinoinensis]XP_042960792.1 disease resistance protein Roq1-like [Carya illinoinensi
MTSPNAFQGVLSSPSSSNSPVLTSQSTHDVFLSFRGKDTRNNFAGHLYQALVQNGINTYRDDKELGKGEEISPALLKAIEESKVSIIIFSENYASSTWCLDELLQILRCKESKQQKVVAVYYKVEPSTVRHQNESFKEAFAKHEEKFDDAKVQKWKTALNQTAKLCGFHLKIDEDESKFIQEIVQNVSTSLPNRFDLHVAEYPVGIQSRVEDINNLLCMEENDVHMIGIYGIGGIGKTTIAKQMYNLIAKKFEGRCFLADVRESSKQNQGRLRQLQEKILSNILVKSPRVDDDDQGMELIRNTLCRKKILLVLDDVDCMDQLKRLCGKCDWFGSGSLIIITTRDISLLTNHKVSVKYLMEEMKGDEARQLFTQHAFSSSTDNPIDGFADLIDEALQYAGGLPLALKVVGSNLYGHDRKYWESLLEKYKRIPAEDIQEKLKISYDGLDEPTKSIFLDIACFFKRNKKKDVTKILDDCDVFPKCGIEKLNDKCLITIEDDRLMMHDLLADMGREIIRQESPKKPGKRSRLYFHKDVRHILEENKGTGEIEGILIDLPQEDCLIRLGPKVFAKMKGLRILKITCCRGIFRDGLNYLSKELRVLDWLGCRLDRLPSSFHGNKLIVLNIRGSNISSLGTGLQSRKLTRIDLSYCRYLEYIPDLSSCPNLEELVFDGCISLAEVDDSVGVLEKLVELRLKGCSNFKMLPRSFELGSLELLELEGCTSLENFPEILCEMKHLKRVKIESTVIQELPSSITSLTGLKQLYMYGCKRLVHLPINIFKVECLEDVTVIECPNFVYFGQEVGHNGQSMPQENEISLSKEFLPLTPRESNNLSWTFNFSSSLRYLNLDSIGIISLPPFIEGFVEFSHLSLKDCKQLKEIRYLPPNIKYVEARGCGLLECFPHVSKEVSFGTTELKRLSWIDLSECAKVHVNVGGNLAPNPLLVQERFREKYSTMIIYPGSRIPMWFDYRKENISYTNFIEIEIDRNASMCFGHQIVALVLCFVVGPLPAWTLYGFTISINGQRIGNDDMRLWDSMDPHRVCLKYITGNSIDANLSRSYREGNNNMRFTFESDSERAILKSVGVHLIDGNDNPIQLSKRHHPRDDGEHDLEPDWNPQQKRRGSSTSSSIMEIQRGYG